MKTYPASAEDKLGFDVLRRRLDAYTLGPLGQERVRGMKPVRNVEALRPGLARVAEMQAAFRYDDAVPFDHMLDIREVLRQAAPEEAYVAPEKLVVVRRVLVTLRRLKRYFERRQADYPALYESAGRIRLLERLEQHIERIVDENGRVRDTASPELRRIRRQIDQKEAQLRKALRGALREAMKEGHAADDQPTLRGGRRVIPVRAAAKRKVEGFVQDVSASGQTVYIEPAACLDLNNELRELQADERHEIERLLREVTDRLRSHLDVLHGNVRTLAQLDLLQAKARLANDLDAVVPELNKEGHIAVRGGRNPLLILHFKELAEAERSDTPREVVPLELTLGEDHRTLVITGPNAGGKTVAMKTVGLFALMLSYGLPLPVDPHTQFGLFEQLIIDIGDEQSIEEDLSTFSSHVANLQHMLQQAGSGSLILIDEAGTGTDPQEGGALAQAVLEHLTEVGARTIVTTHHGTLKVFAHEVDGVENGSMEFDQETLSPTYRFQAGTPGSSYAFEIAHRLGLNEQTLERARALVGQQKTAMEELITTFEARTQELERQLEEARTARREAGREREVLEGRLRKLDKERDAIRQQALEEAERIVQGANARIERTIREIKEAEAEREATKAARSRLEEYGENVEKEHDKTEQRQQERKKRREAEEENPEPEPSAAPPRQIEGAIQEGDQVVLDDGSTKGEVLEVEGNEAVLSLGAMRMRVELDRLSRVGGPREQQVSVQTQPGGSGSDMPIMSVRPSVDLRGYRVEEARKEVTQLIDEALAADLERIDILHGKGTGALREALHEYLRARSEVARFEEAPWEEGGAGVTYVYLK